MKNQIIGVGLLTATIIAAAWSVNAADTPREPIPQTPAAAPGAATAHAAAHGDEPKVTGPAVAVPLEGIHNTFRLGRKIISGSCPEGEAGFRALAQQGVKTVISVDGARPDEKSVKKYGMRYVHIPVTYGGISRAQALSISRAVRDLLGPVFIHCHHGKHRGPTAAVLAAMVNEGWTTDQAQAAMKQAGTAQGYTGLWAAARDFKKPTEEELAKADASFPAVVTVQGTAAAMVNIDLRWEHMTEVREAGWKAPASHPDIDPPHEALLLREDFRELLRSPETAKYPADYREKMAAAEASMAELEAALRAGDNEKAQTAYKAVGQTCKSCHTGYRDNRLPGSTIE